MAETVKNGFLVIFIFLILFNFFYLKIKQGDCEINY